jgi:hypothetical protein
LTKLKPSSIARGLNYYGEQKLAFKAVNLTKTIKYESDLDPAKGTEDATVFQLGAIDARVMGNIIDSSRETKYDVEGNTTDKVFQFNMSMLLVRFGLKGISNYQDEDGKEVPFKTDTINFSGKSYVVCSEDIVKSMPLQLIAELAGKITDFNVVSEQDAKN